MNSGSSQNIVSGQTACNKDAILRHIDAHLINQSARNGSG